MELNRNKTDEASQKNKSLKKQSNLKKINNSLKNVPGNRMTNDEYNSSKNDNSDCVDILDKEAQIMQALQVSIILDSNLNHKLISVYSLAS